MSDQQNQNAAGLDALLDGTLDDLEDIPEFRPFPAGAHRCIFSWEQKTVNNHPSIEVKLTAKETVELAKPADDAENKPLVGGETGSVLYMMDNPLGQGKFKEILKALAAHFGSKTTRELLADASGAEVLAVTGLRENKEKTKKYMDIVQIQVV
jgi:hypothetical protein